MKRTTSSPVRLAMAIVGALASLAPASRPADGPDVRARVLTPAKAATGSKIAVTVEMEIGPSWHVNSHTPSEKYLIPTEVKLATSAGTLSEVRYPKDIEKKFSFSDKPLRVYAGTVRFESDLTLPAGATGDASITGQLSYQACNETQCFAPAKIPLETRVSIAGSR